MIYHHDAWTVQSLSLVNQQIAALVVDIIGNYKTAWEHKIVGKCFTVQQINNFTPFITSSSKVL